MFIFLIIIFIQYIYLVINIIRFNKIRIKNHTYFLIRKLISLLFNNYIKLLIIIFYLQFYFMHYKLNNHLIFKIEFRYY